MQYLYCQIREFCTFVLTIYILNDTKSLNGVSSHFVSQIFFCLNKYFSSKNGFMFIFYRDNCVFINFIERNILLKQVLAPYVMRDKLFCKEMLKWNRYNQLSKLYNLSFKNVFLSVHVWIRLPSFPNLCFELFRNLRESLFKIILSFEWSW